MNQKVEEFDKKLIEFDEKYKSMDLLLKQIDPNVIKKLSEDMSKLEKQNTIT